MFLSPACFPQEEPEKLPNKKWSLFLPGQQNPT
jgi:hypothetical protein